MDPQLDFLSEHFDPALALKQQPPLATPVKVKPLDNLNKCRFLLPPSDPNHKSLGKPKENQSSMGKKKEEWEIKKEEIDKKRAEMIIAIQQRAPVVDYRNVLEKIANRHAVGPLSVLHRCFVSKSRIRVWIRSIKAIKGILVGFLRAFDRHMNLVLLDVDEEVWESNVSEEMSQKKHRHFNQLFVKGDSVVMIKQDDSSTASTTTTTS
eukprot:TRINITY_DN3876_c0_g1_i2.p1 TRINITY_DN3876_c0_g1~~TRINITY_DN3876_c0_g1_i2.p1  ORF type:complete len:208 (+),score=39.87 TRINITY_DN3876_c0_g1_i2:223-846(+)